MGDGKVGEVWIILCIFSFFFLLCASIIPFPMYMDMRIFFPWVFKHVVLQVYVTTGVQCMVSVVETSSCRWLRRLVCAASHRIAWRPSPRSVTRARCSVDPTPRGEVASAAWKEQRHSSAGRRSTNRTTPVAVFTSLRRTRRPARRNEALERRVGMYVRVCICPRGDAMGEGEGEGVCATSQIKE